MLMVVEALWPVRAEPSHVLRRWGLHTALFAAALLLTFVGFAANGWLFGAADPAVAQGVGVWHLAGMVLALDALAYGCHVASHKVPLLWRMHRLHHSDTSLDVSTIFRQHPGQFFWYLPVMLGAASLMGASALEVSIYFALERSIQALAHANMPVPAWVSRWMGLVMVTPDFHHTHHSPDAHGTDSNYGELFSFWDRIFRTGSASVPGRTVFGLNPAPERAAAQPAE